MLLTEVLHEIFARENQEVVDQPPAADCGQKFHRGSVAWTDLTNSAE